MTSPLTELHSLLRPTSFLKENPTGKVLNCGDVKPGCDFEIRGNSEEEVLQKAAEHAKSDHGLETIPPDVLEKVRGAIRDEADSRAHGAAAS